MSHWIFQANANHYDIDNALLELGSIRWRVPQYTDQVSPGDSVAFWRSGADAGVIGLGRVQTTPSLSSVPPIERPFVLDSSSEGQAVTRVEVAVKPVHLVAKADVAGCAELSAHRIVTAPMGTVFPLSPEQWSELVQLVGETPPAFEPPKVSGDGPPAPFGWGDRRKDTYPLPGGYESQLDSLRTILQHVRQQRPSVDELADHMQATFGSSPTNARLGSLFVRRVGFVEEQAGRLQVSDPGNRFLESGDGAVIIGQLHARVRFIGELLTLLTDKPLTADELLDAANDSYAMGWTTNAQIVRRRGWLQSAGMISVDEDLRFVLTPDGEKLTTLLTSEAPLVRSEIPAADSPEVQPEPATLQNEPVTSQKTDIDELIERLKRAATASDTPDDFELAVRDVFELLGFRAEKLGGAGKTDVIADAELGLDARYRVIIDGKTTSRGAVSDGQIDWDTLDDHRALHSADYVAVAAPAFQGERLRQRAIDHRVVLLTVTDLTGLLRQHSSSPLELDHFRPLFESFGDASLDTLADAVEEQERFQTVAFACLSAIEEHVSEVGALSARDLFLLLRSSTDLDAAETEIGEALTALASPLVRLLTEETESRFRPCTTRTTSASRLSNLATQLLGDRQSEN